MQGPDHVVSPWSGLSTREQTTWQEILLSSNYRTPKLQDDQANVFKSPHEIKLSQITFHMQMILLSVYWRQANGDVALRLLDTGPPGSLVYIIGITRYFQIVIHLRWVMNGLRSLQLLALYLEIILDLYDTLPISLGIGSCAPGRSRSSWGKLSGTWTRP